MADVTLSPQASNEYTNVIHGSPNAATEKENDAGKGLWTKLKHAIRPKGAYLVYLSIEWKLLKREWPWIVFGLFFTWLHGVITNIAYYIQGTLSVEQRFPLHDLLYELFGEMDEGVRWITDFFVFAFVFAPFGILVASIPFTRLPDLYKYPEAQCRFLVLVAKRAFMLITICLILRCCSFLSTSLPGAAEQCTVVINEECAAKTDVAANCVEPNPLFKPPKTFSDIVLKQDALNGCGDLMFSSHTIYTCSMIIMMIFYWRNKFFAAFLILLQLTIACLIIAARKHYTLDVFTALYVVPLVFLALYAYYPDINNKDRGGVTRRTIMDTYGIDLLEEIDKYYEADGSVRPETNGIEDPTEEVVIVEKPEGQA